MFVTIMSPAHGTNFAPSLSSSPVYYLVIENSGSGTLLVDKHGNKPNMIDLDHDRITYSIVIPAGTDSNTASQIRSIFRVRNATSNPNPSGGGDQTSNGHVKQYIELSHNRSLNHETAPENDFGGREYEFDIKGCDPSRACDAMTVVVELEDVAEINTMSGFISTTGSIRAGEDVRLNLSNLSDTEGGLEYANATWRNSTCPSSKGLGKIPESAGSEVALITFDNYPSSYTISGANVGRPLSIWVQYKTNAYALKWFCHTVARSVPINSSLPIISVSASRQSVIQGENVEFTLSRTSHNLSSPLTIYMYTNQGSVVTIGSIKREHGRNFNATFPANQRTVTVLIETKFFKEMRLEIKVNASYNRPSPYYTTVAVIAANEEPSGRPTITGTTQVGETLTADTSAITDPDGISGSFSYTWWKNGYGPDADTSEQIRRASGSTYHIREADIRHSVFVKVHYRDDRGFNEELQSTNTGTVVSVATAQPYIIGMRLVKYNTGALSFVDERSDFDIPQGQQFGVYVYMSQNVWHLLSWRNQARMRLSVGGQTYVLERYELYRHNSSPPNVVEPEALKFTFHRDVVVGDSGSIVFPRNGIYTIAQDNINPADVAPTPVDFSYPRTYLGNMTVLGSSQQQVSSQQQTQESLEVRDEEDDENDVVIPTLPPITASFVGMSSEHDGSNAFTFELRFSEDVRGFSYKTLKNNGAFRVTNGSIKNARRLVPGANQRWEIKVQPSNNNDISISLPSTTNCSASGAICHSDGRKLSNGRASLVQGPVGISVADASANENTDNTVDFTVSLSRSSANTIKVNYATQDSTATAGQDYTSKSGILTFTAGEISKTVSVSMLSDSIDEGNETFTLKLSSPSGAILGDSTATGTIENSDPMPSAWLSRFGRTIGSQAVNAISSRIGAPTENRVVVGGVEVSLQEETKEVNQGDLQERFKSKWRDSNDQTGRDLNNRSMTLEELAHGTSFNLSGGNGSTGIAWSAWGQFASDSFKGKEGDVNLEGKVASGFVGADLASGHWRGGVAVSSSKGKGDFRSLKSDSVGDKGAVENNLTSIYPYFGYELDDNKAIWGTLGMGEGDLTLTQQNQSIKTDISMRMGAVGAKGPLLSQREGDGMDVILRADGMWVQMGSKKTTEMVSTESDVTRLRLTLDSSKNFNAGEGVLTPSFQMGVRHDGGDAEEGMGLEAGGGVRYVASGLTLEVEARKLLVHEDSKYDEWGVSAAIRIDPDQSGRGLSLNIVPTWGTASSNVDRLWSTEGVHTLRGSDNYKASRQLNAEISYGLWRPFDFLRGLFTPYLSMSLGEESNRTYRTGTRWKVAPNAMMSLEMDHTENQINTEDAFMLRGDFTW